MRKIHNKTITTLNEHLVSGKPVQHNKLSNYLKVGIEYANDDPNHILCRKHNCNYYVYLQYRGVRVCCLGYNNDGSLVICINNGGFNSKTTKEYINLVLGYYNIGYYLRIKNFSMQLVQVSKGIHNVVPNFNGSYVITKQQ